VLPAWMCRSRSTIQAVSTELTSEPLEDLKAYLRFHLLTAGSTVAGRRRLRRRSLIFIRRRCVVCQYNLRGGSDVRVRWTFYLGEALGQEFVRRTFSAETKAKTQTMTLQIEEAMQHEIQGLDWMGPETKKEALRKLHTIRNKIGYPETWRDYSALTIKRDDYYGNVLRSSLI